ncbi:phospho-N-acetylmuramoyl-pentapeptide-transferase [Candidatus Spongiisocius sp.]|uniref:phospho-N-acetylmuramoyl-pentapeptide- transferase n=1 Tax=Candidatus Spongiisocius sp. TaxID=3101273 RepID=UPI003B59A6F4
MIAMLTAATVAFGVAIFGTAYAIRLFRAWNIGQFIQQELEGHMHKSGTPTMGGIVIITAILCGYTVSQFRVRFDDGGIDLVNTGFETPGLLVIGAIVGMGVVGFIDDYQKLSRFRNKGLGITAKLIGQLAVAGLFTWGAVAGGTSTALAFTRPTAVDLGAAAFAIWVLLLLTGFSNAVNFTDGLDGLASGSVALVAAAYMIIAFWIFRHPEIYHVEGSLGLATVASAIMGASLGFLWWNACPARIIMGDVGSQALGGGITAVALLTNTHLLLVILGGLFVIEALSVIIQVAGFRWFGGRRVFRMAPIHHHFEMKEWPETTIITRFWIVAAIGVALGLGIFYGDFLAVGRVGGS